MTPLDSNALHSALDPVPSHWATESGYRDAAVLLPLCHGPGGDQLLFTQRRDDLPTHAGEVSFPGGSREADESPAACALREAAEEIGSDPDTTAVFGSLPARRSGAGFRVTPLVGRLDPDHPLSPDPGEVAEMFSIPLAQLLEEGRWGWQTLSSGDRQFRSPTFAWNDSTIWGLTARLTRDFLARIRRQGLV